MTSSFGFFSGSGVSILINLVPFSLYSKTLSKETKIYRGHFSCHNRFNLSYNIVYNIYIYYDVLLSINVFKSTCTFYPKIHFYLYPLCVALYIVRIFKHFFLSFSNFFFEVGEGVKVNKMWALPNSPSAILAVIIVITAESCNDFTTGTDEV